MTDPIPRDRGQEEPVAPNLALEGVLTKVEDARNRLVLDGGTGHYLGPWHTTPWPNSPQEEARLALDWVLDLLREARP